MAVDEFYGVKSYRLKRSIRYLADSVAELGPGPRTLALGRVIAELEQEIERLRCELARRWFGGAS